jgi:putative molybdopterin biosynthesis protein
MVEARPLSESESQPEKLAAAVRRAARQEQFLEVVDRDEAVARFHRHLTLAPLGKESVTLGEARGRVLAEDVVASVDVPGFDRSNVDGFAVRAVDTAGANDAEPLPCSLTPRF